MVSNISNFLKTRILLLSLGHFSDCADESFTELLRMLCKMENGDVCGPLHRIHMCNGLLSKAFSSQYFIHIR